MSAQAPVKLGVPASAPLPAARSLDDETPPALAMRGVSKRWRKDGAPVLDGLDLVLAPASTVWVGGDNGAGKTTMLRVAAGLIEPERGRAEVYGRTARDNRQRYQRLVSFLPAGDRGLYARLSVRRQLEFWARISLTPRARFRAAVDQAIESFDLGELAERRVDRMSMGQRQRLRLAMTFLTEPHVVLLDEPLTSLDGHGAELLAGAIERLLQREGCVLWCSPAPERVGVHFDTHWQLRKGTLTELPGVVS